jgi:hypothetical protein
VACNRPMAKAVVRSVLNMLSTPLAVLPAN